MKYMRRTAGQTWTGYKTDAQIANVIFIWRLKLPGREAFHRPPSSA